MTIRRDVGVAVMAATAAHVMAVRHRHILRRGSSDTHSSRLHRTNAKQRQQQGHEQAIATHGFIEAQRNRGSKLALRTWR